MITSNWTYSFSRSSQSFRHESKAELSSSVMLTAQQNHSVLKSARALLCRETCSRSVREVILKEGRRLIGQVACVMCMFLIGWKFVGTTYSAVILSETDTVVKCMDLYGIQQLEEYSMKEPRRQKNSIVVFMCLHLNYSLV